jgi:hypothetical protein
VLAIKGMGKDLVEGAIYYRYVGESKAIKPGELRQIIAYREQRAITDFIGNMSAVATGQAATVNLKTGEMNGLTGVLGKVNLGNVVHAPIDDADKNLPTEAVNQLSTVIKETYGQSSKISAQQVSALLKHLSIDDDNIHCVKEKKLKRKYVTRAGINAVAEYIKQQPLEAMQVFGSKAAIQRYSNIEKPA